MPSSTRSTRYIQVIIGIVAAFIAFTIGYRVLTKCEKSSFKLFNVIDVFLGGCSPETACSPPRLQNDTATVTLRNGPNGHNFIFSSSIDQNDIITVKIEIFNLGSASCSIDRKNSSRCDKPVNVSANVNNQGYFADGSFWLDERRGVIRFNGNLILGNLAHITYNDSAVLAAYSIR